MSLERGHASRWMGFTMTLLSVRRGRSVGQILIPVSASLAKAGWSVGAKRFRLARTRASAGSSRGFSGCALRTCSRQSGFCDWSMSDSLQKQPRCELTRCASNGHRQSDRQV